MLALKAVGFDIDGTLYPNREMYLRSIGFVLRNLRLMRRFGRVRHKIRTVRPIEDFYRVQAEMLGAELAIGTDEAAQLINERIYTEWETIIDRVPIYSGVIETVKSFREAGLKVGVTSDFPVSRKLGLLGLEGYWDCAFSSEEVGYLKPNPEPFEQLASRLGCRPEEILYVGNSYKYDVVGAVNAGMHAAHLSRTPVKNTQAVLTFSRFSTLRDWVLENTVSKTR